MSWNFITRAKNYKDIVTLGSDSSRPSMQNIPKAGRAWKLPPPVLEGQTITYRFYDDTYADALVSAIAIRSGPRLIWVFTDRVKVPRKMIGTFKPEDWTVGVVNQHAQAREAWLKARVYFYLGDKTPLPSPISKEAVAALLLARGFTFRRMIYRHHEDLLVNGRKDSSFCGFGCEHKRAGEIVIY